MSVILDMLAEKYSKLPFQLLEFFQIGKPVDQQSIKSIADFLKSREDQTLEVPNSVILNQICEILSNQGFMVPVSKQGVLGINNTYVQTTIGDLNIYKDRDLNSFSLHLSCLVFGFRYIFETYRNAVAPIIHTTYNDDITIGTGFFYRRYFITAKHCLEGSKSISIKGFSAQELSKAQVKYHSDDGIDLAFFEVTKSDRIAQVIDRLDEGRVLDAVITLGYPKIAGFHTIQTVEQGQVSSRLTVTKGEVSGTGKHYLSDMEMTLITAKIRGGNSGGPVLNSTGSVVAVASQMALGKGDYDDLGYGSVIPFKYVEEMIESKNKIAEKLIFTDFV